MKTKKLSLSSFEKLRTITTRQYESLTPDGKQFVYDNHVVVGTPPAEWEQHLANKEHYRKEAERAREGQDKAERDRNKLGEELARLKDENLRLRRCVSLLATGDGMSATETQFRGFHPLMRMAY